MGKICVYRSHIYHQLKEDNYINDDNLTHIPVIPEVLNLHHHWVGDKQVLCTGLFR